MSQLVDASKVFTWLTDSSLKNHGADDYVDGMFELGVETMALPLEEKMNFEQGDDGISFG